MCCRLLIEPHRIAILPPIAKPQGEVPTSPLPRSALPFPADLDGDCTVDVADLLILFNNLGLSAMIPVRNGQRGGRTRQGRV
jgi:hypothetical protein